MLRQGTPTGGTGNLATDAVKAALFNNSVTPDRDAAVTNTGYNSGTWVTANESTGSSEWVAGGRALTGKAVTASAGGLVTFSAAGLPGTVAITMANVYGCLIYDDSFTGGTVQDQGIAYEYFGGNNPVTSGTFSLNWDTRGVAFFTV
jgi:hypothetical protein